jgi:hypothetical protein
MPLLSLQSAKSFGFGNYVAPTGTASYESIQTVQVTSGTSGTLVFSSIPQTYKHLQIRGIVGSAFSNSGTGASGIAVQFNTATGSGRTDYTRAIVLGNGNGSTPSSQLATSTWGGYIQASWQNVNSTGNNTYCPVIIDIYNYASTTLTKTAFLKNGFETSSISTNRSAIFGGFAWNSTAAIDTITFDQTSWVGDGFFRAGSRLSLYGVK